MRNIRWVIGLFLITVTVAAQTDDCPAIVEKALTMTDEICANTERNQACYGHSLLTLQPKDNVGVTAFEAPGDVVSLSAIDSMTLNPLDETEGTWGVVLMRVQANIPDTLPGQNVTFLLFGDVTIEDASDQGDFTPMQAFYFTSGVGDAPCAEAPESGILIQTPEGVEQVQLNVNGANLTLGSTAYIQSYNIPDAEENSGELAVSIIEGTGRIEALGMAQDIPAGSWLRIPQRLRHIRQMGPEARERLRETVGILAPPQKPIPYRQEKFSVLPVRVLERRFEVPRSLTAQEIEQALERLGQRREQEDIEKAFNITVANDLPVPVATFIDGARYVIASGEAIPLTLQGRLHDVTLCAEERCIAFVARVEDGATYTIDRQTFTNPRRFRR